MKSDDSSESDSSDEKMPTKNSKVRSSKKKDDEKSNFKYIDRTAKRCWLQGIATKYS
jgi:predicted peptidase